MQCGLYHISGGERALLPLDGVHVAVRVVNLVAEVQVVQFFVNDKHEPINCIYEFPMDDSAAVCGFEVELTDRLLIGEVKERTTAREEYNRAISQGQTAALLEQDKPDVFHQTIGNIPAMSRVNVRLTYVTELQVDKETGGAIFNLPTSVSPRYNPYSGSSPLSFNQPSWHHYCLGRRVVNPSHIPLGATNGLGWHAWPYSTPTFIVNKQNPASFSITIEVEMASRILSLESRSHQIKMEDSALMDATNKAAASLWSETEPMGKDFELIIYQEQPFVPSVQLEMAPDGSGCAMLTLVPEFEAKPIQTEMVFVVDCSGSMAGSRIEAAKRAMLLFLQSLPMSCTFNIYCFGSTFASLFGSMPTNYSQASLDKAQKYVNAIQANMGGTEILSALQAVFASRMNLGVTRQVFVLTDGEVQNTEQVIALCRKNAHNSRVFTVGIGESVSHHLIRGMARAATGTFENINGKDLNSSSHALDVKLLGQLKLATLPSIVKIAVEWIEEVTAQFSPSFAGSSATPVSKFFPTGPAARSNPHAVGSGQWVLGQHEDASGAQPGGRNASLHQAPFLPPPLFSGTKFVMYCFFNAGEMNTSSQVNVSAEITGSGQLAMTIPVTAVSSVGRTIQILAARALIRDLSEGASHLHFRRNLSTVAGSTMSFQPFCGWVPIGDVQRQDQASAWDLQALTPSPPIVRDELVHLGTRFGLVSKETSFVAVEKWSDGRSGIASGPPDLPTEQVAQMDYFMCLSAPSTLPSQGHYVDKIWRRKSRMGYDLKSERASPYAEQRGSAFSSPLASASFSSSVNFGFGGGQHHGLVSQAAQPAINPSAAPLIASSITPKKTRDFDEDENDCDYDDSEGISLVDEVTKPSPTAYATTMSGGSGSVSLMDFVQIQAFDGSVKFTEHSMAILGFDSIDALRQHHLISLLTKQHSLTEDSACLVLLTLSFLNQLRMTYAQFASSWEVVADKARAFILRTTMQPVSKDANHAVDVLVTQV